MKNDKRTKKERIYKILLTISMTYGSALSISTLTHWAVGFFLIVFVMGHNFDKHWKEDDE